MRLTLLGTVDDGITAVIQEMMAFRCAGLDTSGITASQNPCNKNVLEAMLDPALNFIGMVYRCTYSHIL